MPENNKNSKPGWKAWRFDQIATNVNVRIDNPSESGMEHYVGLEHLDADSLKIRRWGTPDDVEATKLMFKKGDIIFGRRRAYQRKLGVAEFDGICSAHAMVLRAKPEIVLPKFLPFFMQSDLFMNRAVEISVGSLSPTINWKTLALQEFALPPTREQEKLVELFAATNEVIESYRETIKAVAAARQAFLASCFPEDLSMCGRLTQYASVRRLDELAEVRTGLALGKKHDAKKLVNRPYLRVANVLEGGLDLSEIKTIDVRPEDLERYELRKGDVLMTEGGDFDKLGRGTVWQGQVKGCLHQNHVFAVRPDADLLLPAYLAAIARSPHGKRYFLSCAKRTSNLASINKKQLSSFPVIWVPLDDQEKVADQAGSYDLAEEKARERLVRATAFCSGLLKSLFGGHS
ncbi:MULTISPECIES: restriction endonuclease subunit S [Burkholderia]|uniref:restriction endonuclease subunit S n=1 Tax=Burkholderia TaxID=32008 RepID=UPI0003EC765B|nr:MULTISPECIES: restriction endonuclease subunit S [Burkholderia]AHI65570.1 type I restriction modification DNA specificity domain protein [Burkholderia thailandensis H0587]AVR25112.1 restriction endonuclease subunit S [Burkholderia thailandensis]AWU98435.1 restriction endonuclease subunit S [Burkholderia sp. JP2-270]